MASLLNQIQACLKRPKVWRFIGFASAVIGLLCYALSSSFNSLFGKWNLWKTFLYCVFSFIICTAVLFAKVWQHSSSLRFKAHMPFLVLTITSFYSSFFDKHVNRKPDAYNLVSCAAFAVMSLSLSRQIHCGFEVDLLYFFLGALIIQLMKIKWLLGIAGAGFSYFLIILRSCLDVSPEVNTYTELQGQSQVVIEVGSLQLQSDASNGNALVVTPHEGNAQDIAITDSHSSNQASTYTELIKPQLLASIKALKKQNRKLISLLYGQTLVDRFQSDADHNLLIDELPSEIINNLNEAVKLAVAAGFEKECCRLYSLCRREFLRQCLSTLELDDLNKEYTEYEDSTLEPERFDRWIKAFKIAFQMLFPKERRLCDRVFAGFSSIGDLSFVLVYKEVTIRLLNFAETFAVEIRSPKIFATAVEVYMKLSDIIPELESLFPYQFGVPLRNEAIRVRKRLGEAIRGTFMDLENLIRCDSTVAVPGGIYSSTYDVMGCLKRVMRSRITIEQVFKEYPVDANREGMSPSLSVEMAGVMELLESNLEAKSKNYTEPALNYVTMMNNTLHIKRGMEVLSKMTEFPSDGEVELFRLDHIFNNDQIQKYSEKALQSLEEYLRSSWNEVLGFLKLDSNDKSVAPEVAAESMKEKLKLFNIQFGEICSIQSKWFATDDIRKEIIMSIENMLLPAYGNFIGRFQDVLGKHAYEYILYGMFDIKARLDHLFLGGKRMNQ